MRLPPTARRLGPLLASMALLLSACAPATIPKLIPLPDSDLPQQCQAIFPQGQWQFVHTINFTMANGHGSSLLGVTSLDDNKLSCALLTPEGLTLFSAQYSTKQGLKVTRAIPPFTNKSFAQRLMADVRTIFLAPNEKNSQYGRLTDGRLLCRFSQAEEIEDIIVAPSGQTCWQIKSYRPDLTLNRSITAANCKPHTPNPIPQDITLSRPGAQGYTLEIHLLRAEKLPQPTP